MPAGGEPVKVVHAIEPDQIDVLPGKKLIYREWSLLKSQVGAAVGGKGKRIVMQYSPNTTYEGITIDVCNKCTGVWLDAGELAQVATKEEGTGGWFGKIFG